MRWETWVLMTERVRIRSTNHGRSCANCKNSIGKLCLTIPRSYVCKWCCFYATSYPDCVALFSFCDCFRCYEWKQKLFCLFTFAWGFEFLFIAHTTCMYVTELFVYSLLWLFGKTLKAFYRIVSYTGLYILLTCLTLILW